MQKVFLFFLLTMSISSNGFAQNWQEYKGPYGGTLSNLVKNKDCLFTKVSQDFTYNDLYRSTDNGGQWTKLPIPCSQILCAFDSYLFILNNKKELVRSNDNGDTWVNINIDSSVISCLGQKDGVLYAQTNTGIWKSFDNGNSWLMIANKNYDFGQIVQGHENLFALKALTNYVNRSLYRSTDHGRNWDTNFWDINMNNNIISMSIHNRIIAIGISDTNTKHNVYLSKDEGESWEAIGLEDYKVGPIAVNDSFVFAFFYPTTFSNNHQYQYTSNIFRSSDMGKTWVPSEKNSTIIEGFDYIQVYESTLYALGYKGCARSTDNGRTWERMGLPIEIKSLFINDNFLFAGTKEYLTYTSNHGYTWNEIDSINAPFLSNNGFLFFGGEGIHVSSDGGYEWKKVLKTSPKCFFANNNKIYAGINNPNSYGGYGILYSSDNGKLWDTISTQLGWVTALFGKDDVLYAGTILGEIFISTDNGINWTKTQNALRGEVVSFVHKDNYIFAAFLYSNILRSSDNGKTWESVFKNDVFPIRINALVEKDISLFACGLLGIYVSNNNGMKWNYIHSRQNLDCFFIDGDTIYGGTTKNSIWKLALPKTISAVDFENTHRNEDFSIFPNPSDDLCTISFEELSDNMSMAIYNIYGEMMFQCTIDNRNSHFDTSHLPNGKYQVHLWSASERHISTLVIFR